MAKLLLAVVLALFVATEATPDAACGTAPSPTTCDASTEFCEGNTICKIKVGQACTAGQSKCVDSLICPTTGTAVCTCGSGKSANVANTMCRVPLDGACSATLLCNDGLTCKDSKCKKIITGTCDVAAPAACVSGVCTASACVCPAGQIPSADNTGCSGAAFVAASFLSMVAMFVTTRLL